MANELDERGGGGVVLAQPIVVMAQPPYQPAVQMGYQPQVQTGFQSGVQPEYQPQVQPQLQAQGYPQTGNEEAELAKIPGDGDPPPPHWHL